MMNASLESEQKLDQLRLEEYISLAEELSRCHEGLPFPGLDEESYGKLKAVDEEYPGVTTPTDQIIARMQAEGIKVVFGKHPDSGNVFVLPFLSEDIENDSLSPHHLKIIDEMDDLLRRLILLNRARHNKFETRPASDPN